MIDLNIIVILTSLLVVCDIGKIGYPVFVFKPPKIFANQKIGYPRKLGYPPKFGYPLNFEYHSKIHFSQIKMYKR